MVARAQARSPEVQAARSALDVARASQAFGRVPLIGNPVLGARAIFGIPNAGEVSSYNLTFAVPIDVSGQRPLFARESEWAAREADARFAVATNDARERARASYVELACEDSIIVVAEGRLLGAREVLARAHTALEHGAATAVDLALAEREVAEATADLHEARRERDEAAGRFREAIDLTSTDPSRVAPLGPPGFPVGITREAAVRLAVEFRREATAGMAASRRLMVAVDRFRAQYVAPLWVQPELAVSSNQYLQASGGVTVQWALPVMHTGQGERAVALAQSHASRADSVRAARRADREAGTAWDVLAERLAELHTLQAEAIPALERTLEATERQSQLGATDFFRVLYARRELSLMRVRAATATREAWRARIALERAIGVSPHGARRLTSGDQP